MEKVDEYEAKIAALERKVGQLTMEIDILKKLRERTSSHDEHEEVYACEYETMRDVMERLPRFLEETYDCRRLHSSLGYVPPEEYEIEYARKAGQFPEPSLST